eukprot:1349155-Amorphochlora_amoeboformis.AAC.2
MRDLISALFPVPKYRTLIGDRIRVGFRDSDRVENRAPEKGLCVCVCVCGDFFVHCIGVSVCGLRHLIERSMGCEFMPDKGHAIRQHHRSRIVRPKYVYYI